MTLVNTKKARKFFDAKMQFTTGPAELHGMIEGNEPMRIIDVRCSEDYEKGHIPGAINLPKDQWYTLHGLSKTELNVIYCYSEVCHLAAAAARDFAERDCHVMELEGGFEGWEHYDFPIET